MRVAIVGRDYPPRRGGLSTYAHGIVQQLESMGVEVSLMMGGSNLRTLALPLSTSFAEFDVVHAMSPPYAALIRHRNLVVTVAEPVITEFPFYSMRSKFMAIPGYLSELATFHRHAHFIALSETTKEKITKHFRIREEQISVIPGGVDYERFSVERKANKIPRIVLCSRLDKRKNLPEAFRAFAESTGSPGPITVVGDGPERPRLVELARRLGISVEFAGSVSDDSLRDYLTDSEIFVTASLSEGFGLSLIEAMAAGCAVVASKIGAHTELVDSGKNGLIYSSQQDLTDKIDSLLSSPELIPKLGAAARRTAGLYSWNHVARRIFDLYERLSGFPSR